MSEVDYRILYIAQNGKCAYCSKNMFPSKHKSGQANGWTRDHVIPKANGGKRLYGNTVLCCIKCNKDKASAGATPEQLQKITGIYAKYDLIKQGEL